MNFDNLPGSWAVVNLEQCVEILDNKRVPINSSDREKRIEGKQIAQLYPYYGATGQIGFIDDYLFDEELILLGEDGAPFLEFNKKKAYIIQGKTWVNNHAHVLKSIQKIIINKYIENYLNIFDYHQYVTGTTRLKLNQSRMKEIPIPLPPLNEQKRIVAKIELIQERSQIVEKELERVKVLLKKFRRSLLASAFRGDLTKDWRANNPDIESAEVLLERIKQERRSKWEQAELEKMRAKGITPKDDQWKKKYSEPQPVKNIDDLPSIPDGWCWATMDDISLVVQNGIYLHKSLYGSGVPILRIDDFQNDFSLSSSEFQSVNANENDIKKYSLNLNDLIINRVNSMTHLGKCLVITNKHLPSIFESNMMRIRLIELCRVFFVAFYLRSILGKRYLIANAKWAVNQASINQLDVAQVPIPLPPLAEQEEIVRKLEKMMKFADRVEEEVKLAEKKLNQFNQSVLAKAFRGELVPQDPNDEPASVLLEKIQQDKKTTTSKKIKK